MRNLLIVMTMLFASFAWADNEPIGYVKNVTGTAQVVTNGTNSAATAGTPIYLGSLLRTGTASSLGVTFNDETVMSFGPNTELTVDEYLYEPARNKLQLVGRLAKGSLNYVSGVIAKLNPEGVSIVTPSGTIGVRGTQFAAKVED